MWSVMGKQTAQVKKVCYNLLCCFWSVTHYIIFIKGIIMEFYTEVIHVTDFLEGWTEEMESGNLFKTGLCSASFLSKFAWR